MSAYNQQSLERVLRRQLERIAKRADELNRLSKKISTGRLLTFLAGSTLIYASALWGYSTLFILFSLSSVLLFGFLVRNHRRVEHTVEKLNIWKEIRETHLARMKLDWEQLPHKQYNITREEHSYATDLNIIGMHSLHQLIDTALFKGGSDMLTRWLLQNDPGTERIRNRQQLADELSTMAHFRDRIRLQSTLVKSHTSEKDWEMDKLLAWLRSSSPHNYRRALLLLGGLSAVNITLGVLWLAGILNPYVIFTFILYLAVYNYHSEKVKGLFDNAFQIEKLLSKFSTILIYLERYPYKENSNLNSFCKLFHASETRPSKFLKRIIRIASAASAQQSELVWFLLNAVMPWDVYFASKLEQYKHELEPRLTKWLDTFYKLEALCSLANFKWLNPHYRFALPEEQKAGNGIPVLRAKKLGHPLIPESEKVTNDITIRSLGTILLITGSNMAGKSTFLRTVGINLALCFSGGPVNAESLQTIPFRLFTSINIKDSLDRGLSHFYAEVKRLKKLMDTLNKPGKHPLLFFVDEIYKGTNNRERLAGSKAFLKEVAGKAGIGLVSTHDLELARLEDEISALTNYHFEETIEEGKMSFEYKLKPGPCPTTNALKIMEMEGLPI